MPIKLQLLQSQKSEIGSHESESSDMEKTEPKTMRNQMEKNGKDSCSKSWFILASFKSQHQKLIFLDLTQLLSFNQGLETIDKENTWNPCQNSTTNK